MLTDEQRAARIAELETELGEVAETWELMATEIRSHPGPLPAEQKHALAIMCDRAAQRCRSVQWNEPIEPEVNDVGVLGAIAAHLES